MVSPILSWVMWSCLVCFAEFGLVLENLEAPLARGSPCYSRVELMKVCLVLVCFYRGVHASAV